MVVYGLSLTLLCFLLPALSTKVAFHALIRDQAIPFTVRKNDVIKFNQVHTNVGVAYNKDTGIFVAPISGVYFFTLNIVAKEGDFVEASIVKNDIIQATAVSDVRAKTWDQGSASAVLYLEKGDNVGVKVLYPFGIHVLSGHGKTSFGGYLVSL